MSDTAISPHIVSEVSAKQSGTSNLLTENAPKTQVSEFDNVLEKEIDSSDAVFTDLELQELIGFEQLESNSPLLASQLQNPLSAINTVNLNGKALPHQLPNASLPSKNINPLLASNIPIDGEFESNITLLSPTAINNSLLAGAEPSIEEGILTSQLSTTFTDKNMPDLKQLNAQFLNQFFNQARTKPQITTDNNLINAAAPAMIVNQTLSVKSSEAVLPPITVTPENAQWNSQVGERINWMVNNNMQRVEIRLDPPELGNLDIRLNMAKDNQASILIHVTNASAKEAIESAIPRLREMFEQQGLDLGDVDVSQHNSHQEQQSGFNEFGDSEAEQNSLNTTNLQNNDISDNQQVELTGLLHKSENLLDIFA